MTKSFKYTRRGRNIMRTTYYDTKYLRNKAQQFYYFSPAMISMVPLKFPMFQHSFATRNRQDSMALRSSWVGRVMIRCVVHELTWTKPIRVNIKYNITDECTRQ